MNLVVIAEVGEHDHVIVEQHNHALVEDLHSESSVPNMWSYTGIPDDVEGTQQTEQLDLHVVILVEDSWDQGKAHSSKHGNDDVILVPFASVIVDFSIHSFKLLLVGSC